MTAPQGGANGGPEADDASMLAVAGGLIHWLLRLCLAPASTLAGFRAWVLEECQVAPGRRATPRPQPPLPVRRFRKNRQLLPVCLALCSPNGFDDLRSHV